MPGDPGREQTIFTSHESLLLSSAQMLDEVEAEKDRNRQARDREFKLLATVDGVQSLLLIREDNETCDLWGIERPEGFAAWTRRVLRDFQGLAEMLKTGPLSAVQAAGVARGLLVLTDGRRQLLAGMDGNMTMKSIRKAGRELARHLGKDLQAAGNDPANTMALLREPARIRAAPVRQLYSIDYREGKCLGNAPDVSAGVHGGNREGDPLRVQFGTGTG